MAETLCPFGDGRHKKRVWQDVKAGRSGFSCVQCHKTWEWRNLSPDHVRCEPTWQVVDSDAGRG